MPSIGPSDNSKAPEHNLRGEGIIGYENRIRSRLVDVCALTSATLTLAHATLTQIDAPGWTDARIAGLVATVIFAICPLLRRMTGRVPVAAVVFISTLLTASAFAALQNGGISAPTTCFIIVAPLMAGLLLGRRPAIVAGALSLGVLALLATTSTTGLGQASPHSLAELDELRASALAVAVIATTIVVSCYQGVLRRFVSAISEANTDIAASARTIKHNAEELDLIFSNAPVHLLFKDDQNTILRGNRAAAIGAGVTEEALRNVRTEAIYPAMAAKYFADDLEVFKSGVAKLGIIEEIAPAAGPRSWVRTDKVPYVDPATGRRFLFVAAIDITEQRNAEIALAESEQRFVLAAKGSGAGIWDWTDVSADEQYWTPRIFELLGYSPGEIEPSMVTLHALASPDDCERLRVALSDHLGGDAPFYLDLCLNHKTDGARWYRVSGQAIRDTAGVPKRMIGSIIDIDAEKRAEQSLLAHGRSLERSNQALKAFSQAVSHDLRSPLRALDHLAAWTEEDIDAGRLDAAKTHLAAMRVRGQRMAELLEGLRLYALAGGAADAIENVSCRLLVEQAFEVLAPAAFRLDIASDLPAFATAATPLSQVFRNLFDNAVKHHDRDAGVITVRHADAGEFWAFEVADDGPGVAAAFHQRIFEMFEVLQRREDQAGAGAGLAIVKKCVEAAGGVVSVVSGAPHERGATFRFLWPKLWPSDGVGPSATMPRSAAAPVGEPRAA